MQEYLKDVTREIDDLHVFFVDWFGGKAPKEQFRSRFTARFHPGFTFVSPSGQILNLDALTAGIKGAYGARPHLRIKTRDVQIHQDLGSHLMASYTEWQVGGKEPGQPKNGRLTSVLLSKQWPIQWLHVHETWLPDAVQAAGPYDF